MITISTDKNLFLNNERQGDRIVVNFKDGRNSSFPAEGLFTNWTGKQPDYGNFHIGIQSGVGYGSKIKFDNNSQKLIIGNYFAGGWNTKFVLNGMHNTNTPSQSVLGTIPGMKSQPVENLGDTILHHDIWFGDEVFVMGGVKINTGCVVGACSVIPPRKELESFGVYVGQPAKLIKFRFSEEIIDLLIKLAWWHKPLAWLHANHEFMHLDLNADKGKSIEVLKELLRNN